MLASPVTVSNTISPNLDHPYTLTTRTTPVSSSPRKLRHLILPLKSVIPTDFSDMYTTDLLQETNAFGRPLFTERALVDWNINDIRSLLIVDKLKPEWNGIIPTIAERGYRVLWMPLDASDEQIVDTLVSSDIYKEHKFDYKFLLQTAQYTVQAARQRRRNSNSPLTKPEWRNVIENYLLNLGCEAQCRMDYKKACSQIKKQRQMDFKSSEDYKSSASNSLLKKALLTSARSTSPDAPSFLRQPAKPKISLTRQEKQTIWVNVQTKLYAKLGLDWEADELL